MVAIRIYRPAKTAMQSGRAGSRCWVAEFAPGRRPRPGALMGWTGGGDTRRQLRLRFATCAEAVAFAERNGLSYEVEAARERRIVPKSYADNFRSGRPGNWTH